jgi:hypothetical protein
MRLMKMDQNGHDLTQAQPSGSAPVLLAALEQAEGPVGFKDLAIIIDMAEQFDYTFHEELLLGLDFVVKPSLSHRELLIP